MNEYTPFPLVVVTCVRDLALLDLQAQSIQQYLEPGATVYIIVNEANHSYWDEYFNEHIRQYYHKHNLVILYKKEFEALWALRRDPISAGWEDQQILKLLIAQRIKEPYYLILDSQNFLVYPLDRKDFPMTEGRIPYRTGKYVMPLSIWHDYARSVGILLNEPTSNTMAICTPLFMHTSLVKNLIAHHGGEVGFSTWFHTASRIKSEFILYLFWLERSGGFATYHYEKAGWTGSHLRDCPNLHQAVIAFLNHTGKVKHQLWSMINHRAWGDMREGDYKAVCNKLQEYKLVPHFDEYRAKYVNIKI